MRRLLLSAVIAALAVPLHLVAPAQATLPSAPVPSVSGGDLGPELYDIDVTSDIPVTMEDGRVLRAAIHRPVLKGTTTAADGPFPVILVQTPYSKTLGETGVGAVNPALVKRGYIGVIVDVAGTGGSEGRSQLFGQQEAEDGAALVEWAAQVEGSNGKVGTLGGSYLGINQLFTAAEVGPDSPLKAIFPIVASVDPFRDLFSAGGIVNMESSLGLIAGYFGLRTLTPLAERGPADPLDALRLSVEHGLAGIPFELTTGLHVLLQGERTRDGAYWQERAPQRVLDKIVENDIPAYIVGGQYDVFQRGAPLLYSGLQNAWAGRDVHAPMAADQAVTPRYQLMFGPWDHGNPGEGQDMDRLQLQWFDHWLKGRDTQITDTQTPLHVVDSTTGQRRDVARYPTETAPQQAWYLQSDQGLAPTVPDEEKSSTEVVWKPLTLTCQRSLNQWAAGALRDVYEACKQAPSLTSPRPGDSHFDTDPLDEELVLSGPIGLSLQAVSNRPETMFVVTLQDVDPDGKVTDVTAGALLGSDRAIDEDKSWPGADGTYQLPFHPHTKQAQERVRPGEVTRHDIELRPAYTTIRPGHRLRLLVQTSDIPHLLPPPTKLLDLLGGVYRIQTNAVAPSVLTLPVQH
ncbi:CocE/NonD family hydrolase [Aeromicrobium sp. CTD01-1L150]|uniref:CocE/NonD family hydrolase n=1 Tax=Aeromicrobium sp. CTD01-1L150 TaxID=3341830 RepID=UPI0035C1AC7A